MGFRVGIVATVSLCVACPAAAQNSSVAPWVLMSAVASPASSREVCKEREPAEREQAAPARTSDAEEERCALPLPLARGAQGMAAATGRSVASLPLISGLVMVVGATAYLLASRQPAGFLTYPISPP